MEKEGGGERKEKKEGKKNVSTLQKSTNARLDRGAGSTQSSDGTCLEGLQETRGAGLRGVIDGLKNETKSSNIGTVWTIIQ